MLLLVFVQRSKFLEPISMAQWRWWVFLDVQAEFTPTETK